MFIFWVAAPLAQTGSMIDEYLLFIYDILKWTITGEDFTLSFSVTRFVGGGSSGFNIFILPFIMPFMILWFFIWYVCRPFIQIMIALLLHVYNIGVYMIAQIIARPLEIGSLQLVYGLISLINNMSYFLTEEKLWSFFDNFYMGLQAMTMNYQSYATIQYVGIYYTWLLFWPVIYVY